ncbi:hypothetical protein OEA41_004073 [Lepraria neglecta]|uniref:Uncharacterized protein n=1 Tax=Lepraria neglecta TaxID=209136 RepID=A0AAD9Z5F6_9LECA|nr:hypothetical protein OEA41_004073 [Lepraria neglecta]
MTILMNLGTKSYNTAEISSTRTTCKVGGCISPTLSYIGPLKCAKSTLSKLKVRGASVADACSRRESLDRQQTQGFRKAQHAANKDDKRQYPGCIRLEDKYVELLVPDIMLLPFENIVYTRVARRVLEANAGATISVYKMKGRWEAIIYKLFHFTPKAKQEQKEDEKEDLTLGNYQQLCDDVKYRARPRVKKRVSWADLEEASSDSDSKRVRRSCCYEEETLTRESRTGPPATILLINQSADTKELAHQGLKSSRRPQPKESHNPPHTERVYQIAQHSYSLQVALSDLGKDYNQIVVGSLLDCGAWANRRQERSRQGLMGQTWNHSTTLISWLMR